MSKVVFSVKATERQRRDVIEQLVVASLSFRRAVEPGGAKMLIITRAAGDVTERELLAGEKGVLERMPGVQRVE